MKIRAGIITAAALVLSTACLAQTAPAPPAPPAAAPSPPAKIADVAWLQGYWVGEGLGGQVEDVWFPPKAGVLLGAFRLIKADGTPGFYELFAIEEFEGSLRFVVKHFNPDWVGWEEKDKALKIRLTSIGPDEAVFGGIVFTRLGNDAHRVEIAIRAKDGTSRKETINNKRKAL
jgi:uncharacterized protein DUF6265